MINISREAEVNLINILIDQDVISGKDLANIKKISSEENKTQLEAVFQLELTDEDKILDLLVKEQSLEIIDLTTIQITDELKSVLPSNYINMNFIAPFKIDGNILHIAIPDSSKLSLMRNLKTITKKEIELHAAKVSQISDFIDVLSKDGETTIQNIQQANQQKEKTKTFDYDVDESAELLDEAPEEEIEAIENESDVIKFSTAVVAEAIKAGVSDIHIEPFRFSSRVRYRNDGILAEQEHFAKFLHSNYGAVVTRFKIMGKLDIAERRLPQDGASTFKSGTKEVDLRVSILPTKNNERIVMRILNKEAGEKKLSELGFESKDLEKLTKAITSPQGMVLVTGPTGSGKTTTLYSVLKHINKPGMNILTAEDPVEYELEGVGQVQVKEAIDFTFESALRSFLRQDPEVILVGEIRDKATVDIALKASLTGHLVFSTLHTNDAPSSITRLLNMGTPNYLISAALTLIMAQRLARKNCSECAVIDENVTPKLLNAIGFLPEQSARAKIYKGKGCDQCGNTGFKGRMGIYEILEIDKELKHGILSDMSQAELNAIAKKNNFRTMQEMGHDLLLSGDLCYSEFERVLQSN